jgi:hypothetical protein
MVLFLINSKTLFEVADTDFTAAGIAATPHVLRQTRV